MRSLDRCQVCEVGKMHVYVKRNLFRHIVRYRRCSTCRETDKTIQMIPSESSTDFLETRFSSHMIQAVEITHTNTEDRKWLR